MRGSGVKEGRCSEEVTRVKIAREGGRQQHCRIVVLR